MLLGDLKLEKESSIRNFSYFDRERLLERAAAPFLFAAEAANNPSG